MSTPLHRRQLRRRRRRIRTRPGSLTTTVSLERLEPRLLLSDLPRVTAHNLADYTTDKVTDFELTLSEPVVGADARDAASYELLYLGPDQAEGGGDSGDYGPDAAEEAEAV